METFMGGEEMKQFEQSYEKLKAFEKWYEEERQRRCSAPMYSADYRTGWQAALKWIYHAGVLDPSLAGDLIKEELPDGSI